MYINRTLLMLLAITVVFLPSAQEWVTQGGSAWCRPFVIWGLVLLAAYWNQRQSNRDDI